MNALYTLTVKGDEVNDDDTVQDVQKTDASCKVCKLKWMLFFCFINVCCCGWEWLTTAIRACIYFHRLKYKTVREEYCDLDIRPHKRCGCSLTCCPSIPTFCSRMQNYWYKCWIHPLISVKYSVFISQKMSRLIWLW